jgi:aminopeptidase-like protein/aminoglycoside N3'-acetyltransferase
VIDISGDYTPEELVAGLRDVGLQPGDVVFLHVCADNLGSLQGSDSPESRCEALLAALIDVVGQHGTLLVPTYTFSFCKREQFDLQATPTEGGPWSTLVEFLEYFRRLPGTVRSADPIHSVAGRGPRAKELLADVAPTCFGRDSVFDRLHRINGKICMLGVGLYEASFQHHVEEMCGVPFRYKKLFTGHISDRGVERKTGWVYNVRLLSDNSTPDECRLEQKARLNGVCRAARVGRGELLAVEALPYYDLIAAELARDPWFTARGPASDPVALEAARVGARPPIVTVRPNATMPEMVQALWRLPRNIVSEGYDSALGALAEQLPMRIHEYRSGMEAWTWLVPEKWTCHEAYLETLDGRRLFSYAEHPLHVVSYSLPFEGVVSRDTLLKHLHVHHRLADAVPFVFKYYERDWGLCCSRELRDSLTDEEYRVVIRADFSFGTLKVGEVVAPGASEETIVLCAHLCHPAQVNDDLTGVVVGVDVMRALLERPSLRYNYRFLVVPETIGSVAYLSQNESLIPKMRGGLFLEMLGRDYPHSLQLSFDGNTEVDQCFTLALRAHDASAWTGAFGTVIGNDERQFNAPGVRVPMLSLSRVLPASSPDWAYPGYHSSHDTPDRISYDRLAESRDLVLRMIDTLEQNVVPVNLVAGEIFCSRYGLFVDFWKDAQGNRALFDVLPCIDGTRSIAQIAEQRGLAFETVRRIVAELAERGLVSLRNGPRNERGSTQAL